MKKENMIAGFWFKLFVKLIDFSIVAILSIASSFLVLEKKDVWKFKYDWAFYLWCIQIIFLLILFFLIVPSLSRGKTIGNYLTKTKIIEQNNNIIKGILKREVFFSIIWIFLTLLVMIVINHTLIIKYALIDKSKIIFSAWENFRISLVTSLGSVLYVLQIITGISSLVRKDKRGLNDIYAKTKVVRENKFIKIKKENLKPKKISPKLIKNNIIEWV